MRPEAAKLLVYAGVSDAGVRRNISGPVDTAARVAACAGAHQFTCFTGTRVQILTLESPREVCVCVCVCVCV
jgi:hypothetical protein